MLSRASSAARNLEYRHRRCCKYTARIEASPQTWVGILISADVRLLDGRFKLRQLPPEYVKGKAEAVVSFAVEAFSEVQSASQASKHGLSRQCSR
jgi:hypothetical protein